MEMSEKTKTYRKKKGMTLKVLAGKIGCTDAYISQIETGKAMPSISILRKLADAPVIFYTRNNAGSCRNHTRPCVDVTSQEERSINQSY